MQKMTPKPIVFLAIIAALQLVPSVSAENKENSPNIDRSNNHIPKSELIKEIKKQDAFNPANKFKDRSPGSFTLNAAIFRVITSSTPHIKKLQCFQVREAYPNSAAAYHIQPVECQRSPDLTISPAEYPFDGNQSSPNTYDGEMKIRDEKHPDGMYHDMKVHVVARQNNGFPKEIFLRFPTGLPPGRHQPHGGYAHAVF